MGLACVSTILLKLDAEVRPTGPQGKCDALAIPPKLQRLLVAVAVAAIAVTISIASGAPRTSCGSMAEAFRTVRGFEGVFTRNTPT
jgi:hypothetical protein